MVSTKQLGPVLGCGLCSRGEPVDEVQASGREFDHLWHLYAVLPRIYRLEIIHLLFSSERFLEGVDSPPMVKLSDIQLTVALDG